MQMVFQLVEGQILPKLPGPGREPDGKTVLTLEQAASLTGQGPDRLRALWQSQWREFLDPDAGGEAGDVAQRVRADVEHRLCFPELTADEFADVKAFAAAHDFSLWNRHIWTDRRAGENGIAKLEILATIDGLRWKAERTGRYAGQRGPLWCGPNGEWRDHWADTDPPVAARVAVLKTGFAEPCWRVAHWEMYAPFTLERGVKVYPEMWMKGGPHMLAKCGEALAIRTAFPEFGNLYTPEEMAQSRAPRRPRTPAHADSTDASSVDDEIGASEADVHPPETKQQLELRMIDVGVRDPKKRREVIDKFRTTWPGLYRDVEPEFCRRVWQQVSANPERFGADVAFAASA